MSAALKRGMSHTKALSVRGTRENIGLWDMDHVTLHGVDIAVLNRLCLLSFSLKRLDSYQSVESYGRRGIGVHNRVRDAYSKRTLDALGNSRLHWIISLVSITRLRRLVGFLE